jgi:hypothetical protein
MPRTQPFADAMGYGQKLGRVADVERPFAG